VTRPASSSSTSPGCATATPLDWPQGSGYRIDITGVPNVHLEVELSSDRGDHNHAGCLATAMHVLNAIPHVVAADPGVLTILDLPVYGARHALR
jgi:4-hydroxy-tetrahydrodipicolinate reductase